MEEEKNESQICFFSCFSFLTIFINFLKRPQKSCERYLDNKALVFAFKQFVLFSYLRLKYVFQFAHFTNSYSGINID